MQLFTTRLKGLRGRESQADFAARIGVSLATYGRYERGISTPDAETLLRISNVTGADIDWLLFGPGEGKAGPQDIPEAGNDDGSRGSDMAGEAGSDPPRVIELPEHGLVLVPMVEARLVAGCGCFERRGNAERQYAFRLDFLRRKGRVDAMVLMRVAGESMAPEIRDGDVVLIDQSQSRPRAGGIYAVGVEDLVYLKMIDSVPGKLVLSSFNKTFDSFELSVRGDDDGRVRVIGRVIWSCREW